MDVGIDIDLYTDINTDERYLYSVTMAMAILFTRNMMCQYRSRYVYTDIDVSIDFDTGVDFHIMDIDINIDVGTCRYICMECDMKHSIRTDTRDNIDILESVYPC